MSVEDLKAYAPSWDGTVSCIGSSTGHHPLVDYDPTKRVNERLKEIGAVHVRASPDITHMLKGPELSAWELGFFIHCDESLPPNSIVDARSSAQKLGLQRGALYVGTDLAKGSDRTAWVKVADVKDVEIDLGPERGPGD